MSAGGGEKTEQPTAKKRRDARRNGNIAKSRDLAAAMQLVGAIALLRYGGWFMAERMYQFTLKMLEFDFPYLETPERKELLAYALDWAVRLAIIILPFMFLLALIAYLANYYQVGFLFTTKPLAIKFNKLNPVNGLKRVFSTKNIVMLAMNLAKLAIILPIAWYTVISELQNVMILIDMEPIGTFVYATRTVLDLALKLAVILFMLGVADYWYQKRKHTESIKMTKQEVKEEYRQMEGDPKIKQKRRQVQMQQAMQRMMGEVPQAEVVVRNPTHFAVAISYKPEMTEPVVVAKGKDKLAERIIAIARESRVPTVENPPLARELYRLVEVGDPIPEKLFTAVAEILASVMDAEKRQRMLHSFRESAA
ncbi:MAG: flagellar biosynthesis protein FlhB [Planctomycetota bacterium]|jgi:flagellar biosynthetic protein FlhB|nr:flagellar biosynthesis protein FlhB [Planctomycetota bacterium]